MMKQIAYYEAKMAYEIDSWDLYESLNNGKGFIVIDARSVEAFETEHIPNAFNISHRNMNEQSTAHLDKAKIYVTYCDGIGCNASTKGALSMTKLGFQVKELLGGLDWWKRDGYQTKGNNANAGHEITCGC